MESGAVVSSSCLTEESGEQAVLQCGPYTLLTGCGLMWSHVVSCGPDHLWMRSEWSDLSVSHSHLYWELSTCDHITQDRYWLQVRTGTVSLSVQMWGGAAVGVDRYRSLTSTHQTLLPPSITAASIPPSPLPPSITTACLHHHCLHHHCLHHRCLHHHCLPPSPLPPSLHHHCLHPSITTASIPPSPLLPLHKGRYETICFDSYERSWVTSTEASNSNSGDVIMSSEANIWLNWHEAVQQWRTGGALWADLLCTLLFVLFTLHFIRTFSLILFYRYF